MSLKDNAYEKGFERAMLGQACDPPYQTKTLRNAYRDGFRYGIELLERGWKPDITDDGLL